MSEVYKICIPHSKRDFFDYLASDIKPHIGARVVVPFRNKQKLGIVVGKHIHSVSNNAYKLKIIENILDNEPIISEEILSLCVWIAAYYQAPLSEVIVFALPKNYRLGKEAKIIVKRSLKNNNKQSHSSIDDNKKITLNAEQTHAVDVINANLNNFNCYLLEGVTGSGKTEVYFALIEKALQENKQVLILVPEIGLTPQLLNRFNQRFSAQIAVIHSFLNDTERQNSWQLAALGKAKIVIGTRSAIFTPMPSLGLIVVDEEHDTSFKQAEGARYSARDSALMRAHNLNIPIILGSATPSLESIHNVVKGKYQLLKLTEKALTKQALNFKILDIRNLKLEEGIAEETIRTIKENLDNNRQVLVFINRRGFAPILLCHQCGWMADCKACDSHLTMHQKINRLICHHCGLIYPIIKHCKSCKSDDLIPIGIGTERVFSYLKQHFPNYEITKIDRDEVRKKNAFKQCLEDINSGKSRLIIGTQMLAKGHHFPNVTLVVILDADYGFFNQDFRALENLGQLLTQVSGRAGRADLKGQVLIQTHIPKHPLLNLLIQKGYPLFAKELLEQRKLSFLPPFHYLSIIRAQSKDKTRVQNFLVLVKNILNKNKHLILLGPSDAPLGKKNNYFRMQLLIKAESRSQLGMALTKMRDFLANNLKVSSNVRWNVDIDPVDLS